MTVLTVRRAIFFVSTVLMVTLCRPTTSEAQESRVVGRKGAVALSLDASVSGHEQAVSTPVFNSRGALIGTDSSKEWTGDYQTFMDVGRFLTDYLVLDVGTFIGGSIGGSSGYTTGTVGGIRVYATPNAAASVYVSGGGGVVTSHSADSDSSSAGSVYGSGGLEAVVKTNASIFVEGQVQRDFFSGGAENTIRFRVGLRVLF